MPAVAVAGEGEQAVTVSLTMSHIDPGRLLGVDESRAGFGASLGFDYDYAVLDTSKLRAGVNGGTWFAPEGRAWSGSATAGLVLMFPASRYVPYAIIGGGALLSRGGGVENILVPVVEAGFGVDILESRTMSWGVFTSMQLSAQNHSAIFFGVRGSYHSAPAGARH